MSFRRALRQGRGLTVLELQNGVTEDHRQALLEASLENWQYDRSFEEGRAEYLLELADVADMTETIRDALVNAPITEESRDRSQQLDMLSHLARRGDADSRNAIQNSAEKQEEWAQDMLAQLDEAGLRWVIENVLTDLTEEDRFFRISNWRPEDEELETTADQKYLRTLINENVQKTRERIAATTPAKAPSPLDTLNRLRNGQVSIGSVVEFSRHATNEDLAEAATIWFGLTAKHMALRTALMFYKRGFPRPLEELIEVAEDEILGDGAVRILSRINDPKVRTLGLAWLSAELPKWDGLKLLDSNYLPEDFPLIQSCLQGYEPDIDPDEAHRLVTDLLRFIKGDSGRPDAEIATWIFENSPCSYCRIRAVEILERLNAIPDAIRAELPYDAEPEIRKIAVRL